MSKISVMNFRWSNRTRTLKGRSSTLPRLGGRVLLFNPLTGGERLFKLSKLVRSAQGALVSWSFKSSDGITLIVKAS